MTNIAQLYDMDAKGWAQFDARIAAAADRAMISVDAETVGLFRKYKIDMPGDFARDTRWKRDVKRAGSPARLTETETLDIARDRALAMSARLSDTLEVSAAIKAADARRGGNIHAKKYNTLVMA